jgi:hypothetical protein
MSEQKETKTNDFFQTNQKLLRIGIILIVLFMFFNLIIELVRYLFDVIFDFLEHYDSIYQINTDLIIALVALLQIVIGITIFGFVLFYLWKLLVKFHRELEL